MRLDKKSNELLQSVWLALMVCSVLYLICELLLVAGDAAQGDTKVSLTVVAEELQHIVPFLFAFLIPYKQSTGNSAYQGLWSALCYAFYAASFFAVSEHRSTLFSAVLLSILFVFLFRRFERSTALFLTGFLSVLLGVACGYLFDVYENLLILILNTIGSRGGIIAFLFGLLNSFFEMISPDFKTLVYQKSYGGAVWIDNSILTGAKHIFEADAQHTAVYTFLSGRLLQLFIYPGMAMAMSDALKGKKRHALAVLTVCTVLSGNSVLFFLFLLLESPFAFLAAAFLTALCYLTAYLLKLSVGFMESGGLPELIMHLNGNYLLFAAGAAITVLAYFLLKYCILKYGVSEYTTLYIPDALKPAAEALGGVKNIIRFTEKGVEVRNVKRIDTLKLDGEMKENIFYTTDPDVLALEEYL